MLKLVNVALVAFCMVWGYDMRGSSGSKQIVCDGVTNYVIVTGNNQTDAEKYAAEELMTYLGKITGAKFKTVSEKGAVGGDKAIYLGWTDYGKSKGIDYQSLGQEEWVIRTIGDSLIICGGRPRGTLYGVYEFLEKHCGCAWLDNKTEAIPQHKTLSISEINEKAKPAFWGREIYTGYKTDGNGFLVKNKTNATSWGEQKYGGASPYFGSPRTCHTMYQYAKDWPKEHPDHPEYFALNEKGERIKPVNGGVGGMLICLTNPEVRKLVLQKLRAYIAEDRATAKAKGYPHPTIYSISQNDSDGYCVCPDCKAIIDREGAVSGVNLDFINEIAKEIKNEYPDIYIHTFAYTFSLPPPKHIKAEDNVIVQIINHGSEWYPHSCAEHLRPVLHEDNKPFQEVLKRWSEVAQHLSIWDYWSMYKEVQAPYTNVSFVQQDLKFYRDNKVEMFFVQDADDISRVSFQALREWFGYKMMQNPDRTASGLIKKFMDGYYGAASGSMTEYLDYLEMRIAQTPGLYGRLKVRDWQYLDMPFFMKANTLLDQAEALSASNPLYSLNVRRERIPVDCALLNFGDQLESKLVKNEKMPFDRKAVIDRYEKNRTDIIKRCYGGKFQELELEKASCEIKLLRTPPTLPEQFKGREIVDFLWPDFSRRSIDPDAAGGMAIRLGKESPDGPVDHGKPLTIGIYDVTNKIMGPEVTIKKEDIPQDGKYHLYKIGTYPVSERTYVWTGYWLIQIYLNKAFFPPLVRNMEVNVSMKVLGPAYVEGSKDENSISVDRVILVGTDGKGK